MPGGLRLTVKGRHLYIIPGMTLKWWLGMEQNSGSILMASAGDNVDLGVSGIDPSALRYDPFIRFY